MITRNPDSSDLIYYPKNVENGKPENICPKNRERDYSLLSFECIPTESSADL